MRIAAVLLITLSVSGFGDWSKRYWGRGSALHPLVAKQRALSQIRYWAHYYEQLCHSMNGEYLLSLGNYNCDENVMGHPGWVCEIVGTASCKTDKEVLPAAFSFPDTHGFTPWHKPFSAVANGWIEEDVIEKVERYSSDLAKDLVRMCSSQGGRPSVKRNPTSCAQESGGLWLCYAGGTVYCGYP